MYLNLKGIKVLTEKFTEAVSNIFYWQSLIFSFTKANDDSYGFHIMMLNCDEYKAISKVSLMNVKSIKDIRLKNL